MFGPSLYSLPVIIISWRRITSEGAASQFGNVIATVTAINVRKATARPDMPVAFLRLITRYIGSVDPDIGQESTQIPVWGQ